MYILYVMIWILIKIYITFNYICWGAHCPINILQQHYKNLAQYAWVSVTAVYIIFPVWQITCVLTGSMIGKDTWMFKWIMYSTCILSMI